MKIPRAKPAAASLRSQTAKLRSPLALARRGAGDTAHAFDRGRRPVEFLGFINSVVAAFPHCEVHAIRDRNTQYPFPLLLPRHCSRAVARQGPPRASHLCASRLPSLSWP